MGWESSAKDRSARLHALNELFLRATVSVSDPEFNSSWLRRAFVGITARSIGGCGLESRETNHGILTGNPPYSIPPYSSRIDRGIALTAPRSSPMPRGSMRTGQRRRPAGGFAHLGLFESKMQESCKTTIGPALEA